MSGSLSLDDFSIETGGNDTEIELTPSEVLFQLQEAWMNEQFAPDLLCHKFDIVDCVLDQLQAMEGNLAKSRSNSKNSTNDLRLHVHRMEVRNSTNDGVSTSRVEGGASGYRGYLRKRLEKIEQFVFHCLDRDERRIADGLEGKMSKEEQKFALEFRSSIEQHVNASVLQHIPANIRKFDFAKAVPPPNSEHYVFLRVNRTTDGVIVSDPLDDTHEESVRLEKGTQHLMPFKAVSSLVENGAVTLI